MALYTTTTKVKREAGFQNNTNIVDASDVTPHLDAAEAEVNGRIGTRYTLALSANSLFTGSPGEAIVIDLSTRLAAGLMMIQQFEGQGGRMDDEAYRKIKDVREQLDRIADGSLKLFNTGGSEFSTNDASLATIEGYPDNTADEDQGDTANPRKFTMDSIF